MNAIEAEGLRKSYPGGVQALAGLDLAVEAGSIFGLLGPNGAGKSTTVKILTTLSRADEGRATVAGFDVVERPADVRRAVGVVSQRSGVDPEATGRENLVLQGQLYGLSKQQLRERVPELLDRFGLSDAADRLARTYSGGMQRKLDVAMGLIQRPGVLFLDEPTTGLDPKARAEVWREISRLAEQEGLTILLTTHYMEEADRLAGRLAIVERGRIVAAGSPDELKGELHGDSIHVELGEPEANGRVTGALRQLAGVRDVKLEGRSLHARADSGATALPSFLAALERAGVRVASVTVSRPSLDDVYLRHAGRTFDEADADEERSNR